MVDKDSLGTETKGMRDAFQAVLKILFFGSRCK